MGVLDGRVVLVTGGGNGIGRECALLAAREGAKVVVNDLGGSVTGRDEGTTDPASEVVREIVAAGGEAVADRGSVTEMDDVRAMIALAHATFGGLHSVINPAGFLRDTMYHKMADEDWDAVIAVHLRGAYNVTRATIEAFRTAGDGSYVLFTSTTGLIGNIGQANYAAAKLGVHGLSRIIAMENGAKGVRSNVIAPFAFTRMIGSIPIKDEASAQRVQRMKDGMRADQVAPLAIALCAPGKTDPNGQIFAVRGNEVVLFNQPRPVRSMTQATGWSAQDLLDTAMPAMAPSFTDLGASASVFPYDPV